MVIGSGLIAQAFSLLFARSEDVCIYAAGVSNSNCTDTNEFLRERQHLTAALECAEDLRSFVYFGTCSAVDSEARYTPYVQHKLAMEELVSQCPRHLIFRLPQVAGRTPNPHTLLNFLYARISRSEAFHLWRNAKRNIIDVDDVVAIANQLIRDDSVRNVMLNIANPVNYPMIDIINAMELAIGKRAIYYLDDRGSECPIDTSAIVLAQDKANVKFGEFYLEQVIRKYFEKAS